MPRQQAGHMTAPDRCGIIDLSLLHQRGRSLIAHPPSIPPFKSPARVMVLSAVSGAAATSGPVRRTGIARSTTSYVDHALTGPPRNCLHPRPGAIVCWRL